MKENNTEERRVIRTILSSMKNIEIDNRATLSDQEIIAVLHKEIKIRNKSIEGAQKNNRQDLIEEALADVNIINQFIPAGLSDEEIRVITPNQLPNLEQKILRIWVK